MDKITSKIFGGGGRKRLVFPALFLASLLFFSCENLFKKDHCIKNKSSYDVTVSLPEYGKTFDLKIGESRTEFIYPNPDVVIKNDVPAYAVASITWTDIIDLKKENIKIKNLYGKDIKIISNKWNYEIIIADKEKKDVSLYLSDIKFSFFAKNDNEWIFLNDCEMKKEIDNLYVLY